MRARAGCYETRHGSTARGVDELSPPVRGELKQQTGFSLVQAAQQVPQDNPIRPSSASCSPAVAAYSIPSKQLLEACLLIRASAGASSTT